MHTAAQVIMTAHNAAASTGIFDTINSLTSQANATLKTVSVLIAAVVVVGASVGKTWRFFASMTALAVVAVWLIAFGGISYLASQLNGDLSATALVPMMSSTLIG